jgi:putative hydrolase of the HAD superfamily
MPQVKAVITDYIGTLASPRRYTLEASITKLHDALTDVGFETERQKFFDAYAKAHEKYRLVRYGEFKEVTNAVWVSETLCSLGYEVNVDDSRMKTALNVFFQGFIDSLALRPHAAKLLTKASEKFKLGLISNFTYAPVVHASLRQLGINQFFNAIVVSEESGWRKPHKKIFTDTLERLQVTPEETVYIGDSPIEDIKGAAEAGFKTVFVPSQFNSLKDLHASGQKPDTIAEDLEEICRNLASITTR